METPLHLGAAVIRSRTGEILPTAPEGDIAASDFGRSAILEPLLIGLARVKPPKVNAGCACDKFYNGTSTYMHDQKC